jgi:hypothetical protein
MAPCGVAAVAISVKLIGSIAMLPLLLAQAMWGSPSPGDRNYANPKLGATGRSDQ